MNEIPAYFKYWGKAEKEGNKYHLLVYHCLDVAAVGHILLSSNSNQLQKHEQICEISDDRFLSWLDFLFALHDIGKFAYCFQNVKPNLVQRFQGDAKIKSFYQKQHHTILGYGLCRDIIFPEIMEKDGKLDLYEKEDLLDLILPWLWAVTGHHGRPPQENMGQFPIEMYFPESALTDVSKFVQNVWNLFTLKEIPFTPDDFDHFYKPFKRYSWLLAGLMVTADWIGSNRVWFEFEKKEKTLEIYWQEALQKARRAVHESGLSPVAPKTIVCVTDLFPVVETPTPMQAKIESLPIAEKGQLAIIEEITGGGKTEAALMLASRLMSKGLADGIYLALPTMATSNAMYGRIEKVYQGLYESGEEPTLILAHSSARMVLSHWWEQKVEKKHLSDDETEAVENSIAWLSDSRKKALLANVGVGTIDQALLSILSVKHQCLRLFGLTRKVLIIDEVHACDVYVFRLLCSLLQFHAAYGGSAILLSATLPYAMRTRLINAFAGGAGLSCVTPTETAYPLLSHFSSNGLCEETVDSRQDISRSVKIEVFQSEDEVRGKLHDVMESGQCACWVRNTVKDALSAYGQWKDQWGEARVILFHSRYALGDRLAIEKKVLKCFGVQSTVKERKGVLLIATQVVEQSLDIDFDYMVTDLAPIDLLIQRAGRLRRHRRDAEGNSVKTKDQRGEIILGVCMPGVTDSDTGDWYKSMFSFAAFVYPHHGQLWLTAKWFYEHGEFSMPRDARDMIEFVYSEDRRTLLSQALLDIEIKAEGADRGEVSLGHLNSLNLDEGYRVTMNHWQDDENAPTRLGEATVMVRLARLVDGKFQSWITGTRHDWELSQLAIGKWFISSEAPDYEADIKHLKESMPDQGRYTVVIPLIFNEGKWTGKGLDKDNQQVVIEYSERTGLRILKGEDE